MGLALVLNAEEEAQSCKYGHIVCIFTYGQPMQTCTLLTAAQGHRSIAHRALCLHAIRPGVNFEPRRGMLREPGSLRSRREWALESQLANGEDKARLEEMPCINKSLVH